jgi:polyphosphate kinase
MLAGAGSLMQSQYECLRSLLAELEKADVARIGTDRLTEDEMSFLERYFSESIYTVLSPMLAVSDGYQPLIQSRRMHICVRLAGDQPDSDVHAFIPLSGNIRRFVYLPSGRGTRFVLVEDVIRMFLPKFFVGKEILESAVFRATRNADMTVRDELATDFLAEMEEAVRQRKEGHFVRLELDRKVSRNMETALRNTFSIEKSSLFIQDGPLDLGSFSEIAGLPGLSSLRAAKWTPQPSADIRDLDDLFGEISRGDKLLVHPFESFDPVVELLKHAAKDESVLAIKQILYRTSSDSQVIEALREASLNGKHVTVLVELKARFDESRNIEWARELEMCGAQVIYGIKGLKTHAKICLIVRREPHGIVKYMHFGTGNYNEKTARLYTDIGLLTSDEDLGADASAFFNVITGYSEPQRFAKLFAAPSGMKDKIIDLIKAEADRSRAGQKAFIKAKMNSLADTDVIDALYNASNAGVQILLNVRGICCLKPGVRGMSQNITVKSIVDRFLEHSRIFCFHAGGRNELYISSADWMPRNLVRRIELMVPVLDRNCREKLIKLLDTCLADNVKGAVLNSDGSYVRETDAARRRRVRSQEVLCNEAVRKAEERRAENTKVFEPHRPD